MSGEELFMRRQKVISKYSTRAHQGNEKLIVSWE